MIVVEQQHPEKSLPRSQARLRLLSVVLSVAVLCCGSAEATDSQSTGVLQLTSGDVIAGELRSTDAPSLLRWEMEGAVGEYEFPWAAIAAATMSAGDAQAALGDYCVELHDGSVLFGSLGKVDKQWLVLDSSAKQEAPAKDHAGLGKLKIRRDRVRRISRWNDGTDLVYLGPDRLADWNPNEPKAWEQRSGVLATRKQSSHIHRNIKLPPQAVIEVELAWEKKADFVFALGVTDLEASLSDAFKIGVLGESMVAMRELADAADLALLHNLQPGAGRAHLVLYLDQAKGQLIVTDGSGKQLAELNVASKAPNLGPGVWLTNQRGDVRLERLRVRRWAGRPPAKVAGERTRFLLEDGTVVEGDWIGFDPQAGKLQLASEPTSEANNELAEKADPEAKPKEAKPKEAKPEEAKPEEAKPEEAKPEAGQGTESEIDPNEATPSQIREYALAKVVDISFARRLEKLPRQQMRISLHDGTRLSGTLVKIKAGRLHMRCEGLADPISIALAAVRSLESTSAATGKQLELAKGKKARLETDASRMQGVLISAKTTEQGSCLVWQPRGSLNALPLSHEIDGRLRFRDPPIKLPQNVAHGRGGMRILGLGGLQAAPTQNTRPGEPSLYLRSGDRLPCKVESIDDRGVTISSPLIEATFVPHEQIKAAELITQGVDGRMTSDRRERLLMLPRMQRDNPPTHLLVSAYGDYLRCRLIKLDKREVTIEVRLEEKKIERRRVARIIWLDAPSEQGPSKQEEANSQLEEPSVERDAGENMGDGEPVAEVPVAPALDPARIDQLIGQELNEGAAAEDDAAETEVIEGGAAPQVAVGPAARTLRLQAVQSDGVRLTFRPEELAESTLRGRSDVLAACQVDLKKIDELLLGSRIEQVAAELAYQKWRMTVAADPRENNGEGGATAVDSPLVGKQAPAVKLPWVRGGRLEDRKPLRIADYQGKVLVLDFWASWCGPCTTAMPMLDAVAKDYKDRNVVLVAVNMAETPKKIVAALERMNIDPLVALDRDGVAAQRYQVSGIPQTVVIDREGKVAKVFVGSSPKFEEQLRELLDEVSFE